VAELLPASKQAEVSTWAWTVLAAAAGCKRRSHRVYVPALGTLSVRVSVPLSVDGAGQVTEVEVGVGVLVVVGVGVGVEVGVGVLVGVGVGSGVDVAVEFIVLPES
jgi:hypothetical protein